MAENSSWLHTWAVNMDELVPDVKSLAAEEDAVWTKHSIYKIPEGFGVSRRRHAYQPQVVSLGPYHHHDEKLQPMAEHKERALLHFVGRSEKSILSYIAALKEVAEQLMLSYEELDEEWQDEDKFLQLMIVDGCFMIEILRTIGVMPSDYAQTDPIFSPHGVLHVMPRMKRDMLMLENQIPLLVLKTLLAVENRSPVQGDQATNQLVLNFFSDRASSQEELGLHVLDVVRKSMLGPPTSEVIQTVRKKTINVIWPATELQEAGIRFKRSRTTSLKDIYFEKDVLSLPEMVVDEATESKFLNLMAFEHLHMGAGTEVSSYVWFMDSIIDSKKDVILLSQKDIIKNFVGTDQAVADLFNGISDDVPFDPHSSLYAAHQEVIRYCSYPRRKLMAEFRHGWNKYFYSPWVLVASVGGTIALVVTVMQLAYAMLAFYSRTR